MKIFPPRGSLLVFLALIMPLAAEAANSARFTGKALIRLHGDKENSMIRFQFTRRGVEGTLSLTGSAVTFRGRMSTSGRYVARIHDGSGYRGALRGTARRGKFHGKGWVNLPEKGTAHLNYSVTENRPPSLGNDSVLGWYWINFRRQSTDKLKTLKIYVSQSFWQSIRELYECTSVYEFVPDYANVYVTSCITDLDPGDIFHTGGNLNFLTKDGRAMAGSYLMNTDLNDEITVSFHWIGPTAGTYTNFKVLSV